MTDEPFELSPAQEREIRAIVAKHANAAGYLPPPGTVTSGEFMRAYDRELARLFHQRLAGAADAWTNVLRIAEGDAVSDDQKFVIATDVQSTGYLQAACPGCHRLRLELYADEDGERAVGVRCEKCGSTWMLDPATAGPSGDYQEHDPLRDGTETADDLHDAR